MDLSWKNYMKKEFHPAKIDDPADCPLINVLQFLTGFYHAVMRLTLFQGLD